MNRTALTMAMFTALLQPLAVLGDPPNAELPPATDVKSTQQVDLRGEWELVLKSRGPVLGLPSDEEAMELWIIADKTWTRTIVGIPVTGNYSLDNKQTPHHIDLSGMDDGRPVTAKGVYLLKHNVLILKTSQEGKPRPTTIDFSPDEAGVEFSVLVRISSAAENTPFVPLILSEASEMATVSVAKALFEQQDGKYFLACVRVTNKSDREIGVDLRSRQYCVGINQWSGTDTAERIIINESREIPVPFTPEEQAKLVAAFHAEKLVRVPVGKHVDYHYPFIGEERSSNRAAVEKLKTKFVILSMDGELRVTNGEQTELLRCGEPGDADVSIPRPVTWHRVPFGGRIVSDDGILVEGTSPDDVEEVRLTPVEPGSGWLIRFFPDGSGYAQYGSARGDRANLPPGSISLGALLKAACCLKSDQPLEQGSTFSVSFKDGTNQTFSLTDDTLLRFLMASLEEQWQASAGRDHWDTLRRQHPIFTDGTPARETPKDVPAERPVTKVDAGNVVELWLHPPRKSGWYLRFFSDGSAQAQYGSGLADGANLPKGTVHFGALVNAAGRLKSDQQADRASQVSVHFKNETQTAYFLRDDTLFRYLIESFDGKWQQELGIERFQQLRRQYPIYKDN